MRQYILTEEQIESLGIDKKVVEGCLMIPEVGYTKAEMEAAFGEIIPLEKWDKIVESYLLLTKGLKAHGNIKELCDYISEYIN